MNGYAVIPNVLTEGECLQGQDEFWHAMHTGSGGKLTRPTGREDLKDFKFTTDWPMNKHGIFEDGVFAHLPFVHHLRTHPRIALIYAMLYGTGERLVVAPDRINYQLPVEWLPRQRALVKKGIETDEHGNAQWSVREEATWLHCDQALTRPGLWCIQGLVQLTPAEQVGDATLEVVPGSHLYHETLETESMLGRTLAPEKRRENWIKLTDEDKARPMFDTKKLISVRAPAGAFMIWDSRVLHQGGRIRTCRPNPVPRLAVYVCMQPVLSPEGLPPKEVAKKRACFEKLRVTAHWPLKTRVFAPPRTYGKLNVPTFDLSHLVVQHPEANPILAHFYGLNQQIGFDLLAHTKGQEKQSPPLLNFAPLSGVNVVRGGGAAAANPLKRKPCAEDQDVRPTTMLKRARVEKEEEVRVVGM